ncbi:type II toxin-antitoxin system RelE/ParE family toxin [Mucilaginibacter sp. JRF]|nr:type II toxin-antitoxin system RelE/ParE family toxin [Mucilaginibacter sp. JRF]
MALRVNWTTEAVNSYKSIIDYLSKEWTIKEVEYFSERVDALINNISIQPYLFKASSIKQIRKAAIGKQNSLFYIIRSDEIFLLQFWDNRQDPNKRKY